MGKQDAKPQCENLHLRSIHSNGNKKLFSGVRKCHKELCKGGGMTDFAHQLTQIPPFCMLISSTMISLELN